LKKGTDVGHTLTVERKRFSKRDKQNEVPAPLKGVNQINPNKKAHRKAHKEKTVQTPAPGKRKAGQGDYTTQSGNRGERMRKRKCFRVSGELRQLGRGNEEEKR